MGIQLIPIIWRKRISNTKSGRHNVLSHGPPKIGQYTTLVVEHQLAGRRHPEHGYRACLGLLNLTRKYGQDRLEAACHRANHINAMNYKSIASILSKGLDNLPLEDSDTDSNGEQQVELPLTHLNVRGANYYH